MRLRGKLLQYESIFYESIVIGKRNQQRAKPNTLTGSTYIVVAKSLINPATFKSCNNKNVPVYFIIYSILMFNFDLYLICVSCMKEKQIKI